MHRSFWDLEVHAKDFQQRRWAEAARRRRADEAMGIQASAANPFDLGIARFMSTVRAWLASGHTRRAPHGNGRAELAASAQTAAVLENSVRVPRVRPGWPAQPYADMMIIARGPKMDVEVVEEPSVVRDC